MLITPFTTKNSILKHLKNPIYANLGLYLPIQIELEQGERGWWYWWLAAIGDWRHRRPVHGGSRGRTWLARVADRGSPEWGRRSGEVDWACADDRSNWWPTNRGARRRMAKVGEEGRVGLKQGRWWMPERETGPRGWVFGFGGFAIFDCLICIIHWLFV